MNPFILRQPAITEKAYRGMDKSIYTFWVEPTATKGQIKLAVESTFGVNVMAVNTVPVNGKTKRTGRTVLAYYGEQALEGTRQAQFHVDPQGVVVEITIFLTAQLDAESIEGTYGKPPQRTFVEDTFQKVWLYPTQGVTVYFNKEGNVEALTFAPGTKSQPKPQATADKEATPAAAR